MDLRHIGGLAVGDLYGFIVVHRCSLVGRGGGESRGCLEARTRIAAGIYDSMPLDEDESKLRR